MPEEAQVRVVLYSPNHLFRRGLARLMAPYAEVETADSLETLVDAASQEPVDTLIIDQKGWEEVGADSRWSSLFSLFLVPDIQVVFVNLESQMVHMVRAQYMAYTTAEEFLRLVLG